MIQPVPSSEGIGAVHHLHGGISNTPELSKMDSRPMFPMPPGSDSKTSSPSFKPSSLEDHKTHHKHNDKNQKQYCHWKLGTINVLTASDDFHLHECLRQCSRANLDICCFQEFRRLGHDSLQIPITIDGQTHVWDVWWSGYKKKREYGVAVAIRSKKQIKVENICQISPRLMSVECVCYGMKLKIVCAYAPQELRPLSEKNAFYHLLNEHCKIKKGYQLVVAGDMNATADYCVSFVGGKKSEIVNANDNGNRFGEFLIKEELALLNTWFEHKKLHKDTWYSNAGNCSKTIDYFAMSKWLMQYAVDCRVRMSYTFNKSDHRLLICRMKTPRRKRDRNRFIKKTKKKKMFDIGSLKDEYVRSNFANKVDELCLSIENPNVDVSTCSVLTSVLEDAAKHTLPNAIKTIESRIWDNDAELQSLCTARDKLDRNKNKKPHKELTNKIQQRFDKLRNDFYQGEADKISDAYEARNLEKVYRLSKNKLINKKATEITCPGLKDHFLKHLTHPDPSDTEPNEIIDPPEFIKRLSESGIADMNDLNEHLQLPPSSEEIRTIIKKLKDKKASSDIPAEYLKAIIDCPNYLSMLESLYYEVWSDVVLAEAWRKQVITPLYKNKGNRRDAKNYRGLCIGSTFLKLAMAIILERIKPWYNRQLMPNQNGFRQGVGCPDAIYALKSIQHVRYRQNKETYLLFIDLTAAYDWCVRTWLFHSLYNRISEDDVPTYTCIRIMDELYKKTECALKGEELQFFETTSGVRQGGPESPCLFNLYLDYIMRIYNHRAKEQGLGLTLKYRIKDQVRKRGEIYRGEGFYSWIGYADDLAVTATCKEELQLAANLLSELLTTFGLVINIDKTKSMIMNFQGVTYPESIITINNAAIENVENFVYLGSLINNNHPGIDDHEIGRRIGMAVSKFASMKAVLCNYKLKLNIRVRFYEVYVRTRLTYCSEIWSLTQAQMNHIEASHIKFIRKLVRGGMARISSRKEIKDAKEKAKNGDSSDLENINWAYRHTNKQIMSIVKTPKLCEYINKQNHRWVAHICRQDNHAVTKQLMFPDEISTRIGGRPNTVLENVLKYQYDVKFKSPEVFFRECYDRKI